MIGQGTLGPDFPAEDLLVSPEQLILMSDNMNGSDVFVRAGDLVKNRSDVRPLCRAVHILTADRGQRGSLRIVG